MSYKGYSHVSVRAPNGGGKSESLVMTNCLGLGADRNLVVTAKGGEVASITLRHRRDRLKQNVAIINPWRIDDLPNFDFNPLQVLVRMAATGDPEIVDFARAIFSVLVPEPEQSGDNKFFREAAKDLLVWLAIALAYWEAETGELVCNLPYLYRVIGGGDESLGPWLVRMQSTDAGSGLLKVAAGRITAKAKRSEKTFENVLSEAQNALAIFDPHGPLGRAMEYSDFDPQDLKNKKMSIYIVAPPEKLIGEYGKWMGLVVDVLIRTCLQARKAEPRVTFLLDEFANLSTTALPAILPALYIGRAYGTQIVTFVQDRRSYERYGKESSAFDTQCDVICSWGVRDLNDAEWIEKRSGQASVITESGTIPADASSGDLDTGRASMGLSEKAIPVIRKDQAIQLPDHTHLIFYKNKAPILADLISYKMVDPWVRQADIPQGDPERFPIRFKLKGR
nr:type IV secretory system conjugative DNA transfer family protein [Jiella mangrovi]